MSAPRLDVRDLTFAWPRRAPVLRGVHLRLHSGELVALIGPNGSGKSTLLKLILSDEALAHAPWTGQLLIDGVNARALSARARARALAYVPQQLPEGLRFTVEECVRLGRHPWLDPLGRDTDAGRRAIEEALESCEIHDLRDRLYEELSGGERQRVLLAACLAQRASTLLLDEPTSALDLHHALSTLQALQRLARGGHAVLFASHDINLAAQIADRLVVLHRGAIAADGPPAEVLSVELLREVYGVHACLLPAPGRAAPLVLPLEPARP